jgi:hypothetical protein
MYDSNSISRVSIILRDPKGRNILLNTYKVVQEESAKPRAYFDSVIVSDIE